MATKKLSKPMQTVLLAADADGWITKSDAPTNTSVALIDRKLIGYTEWRDDEQGHWLTEAGKAKVAELRGETAQPTGDAPEIRVGDLIEIRKPGKRKWAMRVSRVNGGDLLEGKQVRMVDGRETRTRVIAVKPDEYTIIERVKPCTECHMTGPHKLDCSKRRTVAAEQPRNTVTANVKLTNAQVDALHFFGAPLAVQQRWRHHHPHGRTVKALRARLLLNADSRDLTAEGRDAYMISPPTGRLSQEFSLMRTAAKALTSDPTPAVEPDGPACLADEPTYAHDAHCNTIHEAGPKSCPPARGSIVVECTVEANPTTDTIVIERDEWNAMTPEQRLRTIEHHALESVNQAGGWGWGIANETDAAEVASEWKPQAINELIKMVQEHGAISPTRSATRAIRLDAIRKALWDLVTE